MKKLLYIYAITAVVLTSCTDDVMDSSAFLNGKEKTPIAVSLNVDNKTPQSRALSRAVNGSFETNDQLVAYFRHVKKTSTDPDPVTYEVVKSGKTGTPDLARLVNFKVSALTTGHNGEADNYTTHTVSSILTCTDAQGLYWDDFSEGGKGDATDIRTESPQHYLQSYYGYCYNGGIPTIALGGAADYKTEDGKIKWTVQSDQSVSGNHQKSDLLFSKTQTPVAYDHGTNNTITGRTSVLSIPYTHAMSKVTVEVVCEDGFLSGVDDNFKNASVILSSVKTESNVDAPNASVSPTSATAAVTLSKDVEATDKLSCTFSAVIAPSLIKADAVNPFITLKGIDGNDYKVFLTNAIITSSNETGKDPWSSKLALSTSTSVTPDLTTSGYEEANGGITIPGVNYYIKLTLKKQAISANATIRDWSTVSASANGDIDLPDENYFIEDDPAAPGDPIDVKTMDKDKFKNGSQFSLFTIKYGTDTDDKAERTDTEYKYATICEFVDNSGDVNDYWKNTPEIYWPNVEDKYYFRALASYKGKDSNSAFITDKVGTYDTDKGLSISQGTIADGNDIIWATTPRHIGKLSDTQAETEYPLGDPIPPRKGGVPLAFDHAMTKVTFNLVDANKDATVPTGVEATDYDNPLNPRINLAGAKIQITNLSTTGTIAIEDGEVTAAGYTSGCKVFGDGTGYNPALLNGTDNAITTYLLKEYIMVPQTINDVAMLTVTLANGATYRIQLNKCLTDPADSDSAIGVWNRGRHYVYTITLEKEKITFRALIKDWDTPVTGSGNATLEWD